MAQYRGRVTKTRNSATCARAWSNSTRPTLQSASFHYTLRRWTFTQTGGLLHYQLCYTSGLHHNLTILLSASLSNLQRIRRNFSGEDVTASKALVCRTPQARHAPATQDDGHHMPPVSPVCHRSLLYSLCPFGALN